MVMILRKTTDFKAKGGTTQKAGFTLMELLTVMGIISILLTVASVGVSRIERGSALTSGLAVSEGIFNEARTIALAEGVKTRVVIHSDKGDKENPRRYLRYLAVAVQQKDGNGNPLDNFEIESRGTQLPSGVFFDFAASGKLSMAVASANSGSFGTFSNDQIDFPAPPNSAQPCYFYEFNAEGICVISNSSTSNTSTNNPGAAFVLSDGNRPSDDQDPILDSDKKSAFVVWRNGNTSLYKDISVYN